MTNQQAKELYADANQLMTKIDQEINRPQEDVIGHLVCKNSRQCISNYLTGFLLQHGSAPTNPVTLMDLLEKCQNIDARFKDFDFSTLHCRFDANPEDHYCLEVKKVSECYDIARQIKTLVDN